MQAIASPRLTVEGCQHRIEEHTPSPGAPGQVAVLASYGFTGGALTRATSAFCISVSRACMLSSCVACQRRGSHCRACASLREDDMVDTTNLKSVLQGVDNALKMLLIP